MGPSRPSARMMSVDTDEVIQSQIAYYRARAAQYDVELRRAAEEAMWAEFEPRFRADVAELEAWLEADPPTGHLLELAAGSGARTGSLLRTADRVTAVDAAPEMLARLITKHPTVRIIEADLFCWEPDRQYDNVFFGFWISHIPAAHWHRFWDMVASALRPGGRAWFSDNAHPDHANSRGPGDWPVASGLRQSEALDTEVHVRTLLDGRRFEMVKRYWHPPELARDLAAVGWEADVHNTDFAFIYGTAIPNP